MTQAEEKLLKALLDARRNGVNGSKIAELNQQSWEIIQKEKDSSVPEN